MSTRRFKRGIDEGTSFYGFYVRASGETRELLKKAQQRAKERFGATPSNPLLLDELLKAYLRVGGNG
jgi:hypothetical protein